MRVSSSPPLTSTLTNLTIGVPCLSLFTEDVEAPSSNWINAFKNAVNQINSVNSSVNLTWIDSQGESMKDISVYESSVKIGGIWDSNVIATAEVGSSSNGVGKYIIINPSYNDHGFSITPGNVKASAAMHEIMHSIGFMHAYVNEGVSVFMLPFHNQIQPTVMNTTASFFGSETSLSYYDKLAISTIHPK